MNEDQFWKQKLSEVRVVFIIMLVTGVAAIFFYALSCSCSAPFPLIANSLLLSGAAFVIGGFFGFLFGIPKTLQSDRPSEGKNGGTKNDLSYKINTNLEQISDWLTKMLVGVGLTQLIKLPGYLKTFYTFLIPVFCNEQKGGMYGVSLSIYFLVTGFMAGYLVTRLFFGRLFRIADQSALEEKVEKLLQQQDRDAAALAMTDELLSSNTNSQKYTDKQILDTFKQASPTIRYTIFNLAESNRSKNWKDNKPYMEKLIPIFKALTQTDPENHRSFGELGFALKDKVDPAYAESEKNLTKAIELRKSYKDHGYTFYEYVRALSRIQQDENFKNQKPSSDSVKNSIIDDLAAIKWEVGEAEFKKLLLEDSEVENWMKLNQPVHLQ